MGNVIEITTCEKQSFGSPCRKIDKDHYVDLRTGEYLDYSHSDNRGQNLHGIRQTLNRVRALVNTNVVDADRVRWVTFTYRQDGGKPMTDVKRLYNDYEKFWKRFCYFCKKNNFSKPEYITVVEPQGSGAWHIHAFFIWGDVAPFIQNDVMASLWGHGFTKTKAVENCDNMGVYFSAYLGDVSLDELRQMDSEMQVKALSVSGQVLEKEIVDDSSLIQKKKFVKGGRLFLYPPGMNIVRSTRGIKQPEVEYMSRLEAEEKACSAKQTFSCAYEIIGDDGEVVNRISKAYYNSKRK